MSENLERSLPNSSTELKSMYSHKIMKWELRFIKEFVQLLDSIENKAGNKAIIERLTFLENSDLKCTCRPLTVNTVPQNDGKY